MTAVFIAIVNYRTGPMVVDCLASLESHVPLLGGGRVIVVDNASGDESVVHIGAAIAANGWSAWSEVIALPRNGGFAYGNNRAIERARGLDPSFGTMLFLNPDTVVRPGAIRALLSHLDSHVDAGIVGASVEDGSGARQCTAHPFPSPLTEFVLGSQLGIAARILGLAAMSRPAQDLSHPCDWVSGACFAVRRQVIEQIGLLDEGYFLYFEEVDYCLRARRAGWSCWYVADARVVHHEGSSTGIRDTARRRPAYWFDSRRRYFTRAHGVLGLVAADLLWALGRASFIVRRAIGLRGAPKPERVPPRFALDLLVGDIRAIVRRGLRKSAAGREGAA